MQPNQNFMCLSEQLCTLGFHTHVSLVMWLKFFRLFVMCVIFWRLSSSAGIFSRSGENLHHVFLNLNDLKLSKSVQRWIILSDFKQWINEKWVNTCVDWTNEAFLRTVPSIDGLIYALCNPYQYFIFCHAMIFAHSVLRAQHWSFIVD